VRLDVPMQGWLWDGSLCHAGTSLAHRHQAIPPCSCSFLRNIIPVCHGTNTDHNADHKLFENFCNNAMTGSMTFIIILLRMHQKPSVSLAPSGPTLPGASGWIWGGDHLDRERTPRKGRVQKKRRERREEGFYTGTFFLTFTSPCYLCYFIMTFCTKYSIKRQKKIKTIQVYKITTRTMDVWFVQF